MGPFRQQLIRLLAFLVAIDLAVGVVALFARSDTASVASPAAQRSHTTSRPADAPGGSAAQSGEILAGGRFSKRRTMSGQAISQAAAGTTGTTAPALPSTAAPSTRPPSGSSAGSSPSKARPSAPTAGQPTTTSRSGPATHSTAPSTTAATDEPVTADDTKPPTSVAPANAATTGTSAPPKATTPSSSIGVWTVIDDATGDTVVDSSQAPQANARADIVQSRGANTTKGIGLAVKVAQPLDPTRDPYWTSAATFVLWEVDTSGDGKPDFEIEYFVEGGKLIAGVSRLASSGNQAACEAEAGYTSDNYIVGIDPACLGSPASLSYRATVYYATDPNNQNDDSLTDVSPDGGMSPPERRTAA